MSRNGSGTYNLPAGNPVTTGTTISSSWANSTLSDIGNALTGSLASDGQTTPTNNLPMGNYAHTAVGNATVRNMYASAGQVQDCTFNYLTGVTGTNAILGTASVGMISYATGQTFRLIAAAANTGACTLNINSIGAKAIKRTDGSDLSAGDIALGGAFEVMYDGTNFQLLTDANGKSETFTNITVTGTLTGVDITTTGNTILGNASTDTLNVGNGDLIKDASGNVGIGVTPSAWSEGKAIELRTAGNAIWSAGNADMRILSGAYYNSGYKYSTTGNAVSAYIQSSGSSYWYTAPSGTAGNAITLTQAMTLDASGNLGIGRTPVNKLDIGTSFTSQSTTGINSSSKLIRIGNSEAGILFTTDINTAGASSGTQTSSAQVGYVYFNSTFPTDFVIGTNTQTVASNLRFYNNNAEVMRITSAGKVGIGNTNPTAQLMVEHGRNTSAIVGYTLTDGFNSSINMQAGYGNAAASMLYTGTGEALLLGTANTERMRIDSSGNITATGQISGGYYAPAAGTTAMAFGSYAVTKVTPNATATYTTTVPAAGAQATLIILTSGTSSYVITFGTGFKTTGTLTTGTTTARNFVISFVSDGTNMLETSRTAAYAA